MKPAENTAARTTSGTTGDPGRAFLYADRPTAAPSPVARASAPSPSRTPPQAASTRGQSDKASIGQRKPSAARALSLAPSDGAVGGVWGARPAGTTTSRSASASPVMAATTDRWAQAMGNLQDARQAADVLVRTVDEAIYMVRLSSGVRPFSTVWHASCHRPCVVKFSCTEQDEDSYSQVAGVHQYMRTIQVRVALCPLLNPSCPVFSLSAICQVRDVTTFEVTRMQLLFAYS